MRDQTFFNVIAAVGVVVVLAAFGMGYVGASLAPPIASPSGASTPESYSLTLIEAMNGHWNATTSEPAFYMLGSDGQLHSSANIALPSNTLIDLTIVAYDMPTPGVPSEFASVEGTVGGTMYLINGTTAQMGGSPMDWGQNVSSVPVGSVAHTFTIQKLGINIPVVGMDTQVAQFYLNETGTFTWQCMAPCGTDTSGWGGPMTAPGWMSGTIDVV